MKKSASSASRMTIDPSRFALFLNLFVAAPERAGSRRVARR
ncbi:MAG TPA: hypothetical protein VGO11_21260 [Chthoniobacteraceae bacterium]|nr:hypothetical protein [Chthoniobacteraceae bacterium]